jgi:hypothetical protein
LQFSTFVCRFFDEVLTQSLITNLTHLSICSQMWTGEPTIH